MSVQRRVPVLVAVAGLGSLVVLGLAQAAPSKRGDDPSVPEACTVSTAWKTKGNCGMLAGTNFLGTTDGRPLVLKTSKVERMRIDPGGSVGMGTAAPTNNLDVNIGAAATANAGLTVQGNTSSYGDLGVKLINTGPGGTEWFLDSTNQNSFWGAGKLSFVNGPGEAAPVMTLTSQYNVGIGTTNPDADLTVHHSSGAQNIFDVSDSSGVTALTVSADGTTQARHDLFVYGALLISVPQQTTTRHACYYGTSVHVFAECGSAAEYVPTVDRGSGYPAVGDLVRIAPGLANPYGDHHSPFVVAKSSRACDPNLLGFLLNPKLGADGKKLNSHYQPLGIYGYFPARVTMQAGPIHRGDPITSSSTPGAGMKATGACKTIGYALQDANTTGTIQVFAAQGETTAPAVTKLQARVQTLRTEVQALKRQNATLSARMAAIEQTLRVSARATARAGGHAG